MTPRPSSFSQDLPNIPTSAALPIPRPRHRRSSFWSSVSSPSSSSYSSWSWAGYNILSSRSMSLVSLRSVKRTPFWLLSSMCIILIFLISQPSPSYPSSSVAGGSHYFSSSSSPYTPFSSYHDDDNTDPDFLAHGHNNNNNNEGWGLSLRNFGLSSSSSSEGAGALAKRAEKHRFIPRGTGWRQQGKTYVPHHAETESRHMAGRVNMTGQRVMIYEEYVHDEVVVAIASTLARAGAEVIFENQPRYGFDKIIPSILGYEPVMENPFNPRERTLEKRLKEGELDHLILTTCYETLRGSLSAILASNVHVVCLWHNGGIDFRNAHIDLLRPLAKQGRVSVVTLGEHVAQWARMNVLEWSEGEGEERWAEMPLEVFEPVFDYPALRDRPEPAVWPSTAVIQGNLETLRRNYDKVLKDLKESMIADPALWGYLPPSASSESQAYIPSDEPSDSPFRLLLIGKPNENDPLVIPPELKNVVHILEDLPYPEFYKTVALADLMVPAFYHKGYFENTASSTIPAALIARTPILVSRRHLETYSYLDHPAIVERPISQGDVSAIAEMRRTGRLNGVQVGRGKDAEWDRLMDHLGDRGADLWHRLFAHGARSSTSQSA